jgi:tRNA (cytidine56-2'-O)-methyltransferase
MARVSVFRLSHRPYRDRRISTHCGLVARAFGAEEILYSGVKDTSMELSIRNVVKDWGGSFGVEFERNWRDAIRGFKGRVVHLTMYGIPLQEKIKQIRQNPRIMVVVGGEKVPPDVYKLADFNIAVTSQPHSEVAALAVFLHEYFQGRETGKVFEKPKKKVVPQERGKKVVSPLD